MRSWRIVQSQHVGSAFSGEGAAQYGGRWNPLGFRVVYTSGSQSLAALEILVHIRPEYTLDYHVIPVVFPESLVEKIPADALPEGWQAEPPSRATQDVGRDWIKANRSAVLAVPSTIIPEESNFLLNPHHPDFKELEIGEAKTFTFDERLL